MVNAKFSGGTDANHTPKFSIIPNVDIGIENNMVRLARRFRVTRMGEYMNNLTMFYS